MGKIAASVLLKLFINSYEKCHTTDTPSYVIFTLNNYTNKTHQHQAKHNPQKQHWFVENSGPLLQYLD